MFFEKGMHDLKMAVLEQAVEDWKGICQRGIRNKTYEGLCRAKSQLRELRRFFKSELCHYYADGTVHPDTILQKMEEIYVQSNVKRDIEAIERGDYSSGRACAKRIPKQGTMA